jgi:hypothetical protein
MWPISKSQVIELLMGATQGKIWRDFSGNVLLGTRKMVNNGRVKDTVVSAMSMTCKDIAAVGTKGAVSGFQTVQYSPPSR